MKVDVDQVKNALCSFVFVLYQGNVACGVKLFWGWR